MRNLKTALAASFLAILGCITATGAKPQLKAYAYIVGNFSRIDIAGAMNVDCRHNPDSTGYVVFHTFPEFNKVLKVKNESGVLRLWTDADDIGKNYFMNVTVYSGALDKIENNSSGRVSISSLKIGRKSIFDLNNNSSGQLTINTPITAKTMSIRNISSGKIKSLKQLSTNSINVITNSSGSIDVTNLSAVDVNIKCSSSGSVSVNNLQTTKVDCDNTSSGDIRLDKVTAVSMSANNTSAGNILITGVECSDITCTNSSAGTIRIAGTADNITSKNTGSGAIDTSELSKTK